jgi:hypothetical protein
VGAIRAGRGARLRQVGERGPHLLQA